jgi:(R,R)-butanediol dehydrogenase/meso-butanediol dehydrogenase/diacetyl reductase
MIALRFYGRRDIRLEELPKPKPQDDEVLIRVTDAGISQTQINEFVEGPFIINKDPHPLTNKSIPLIPCQEYGGIVEEIGKEVDKSIMGAQVAVLPLVFCGECEYCQNGKQNLCPKAAYHGLLGMDGGFTKYSVVNKKNIFYVNKQELLTFIEPLLVGLHSANKYRYFSQIDSKKILVLGAGAIGVSVAAVWRDFYEGEVYINDILENRIKKAQKAGFDVLKKEEIKEQFDVVIDAAGMDTMMNYEPSFIEGFKYLKKDGVLINIGTYFHPISFVPSAWLLNEHKIITSIMYDAYDVSLLEDVLASLSVDFSIFIEKTRLSNIIEEGYFRAEIDKESFTRIVVKC